MNYSEELVETLGKVKYFMNTVNKQVEYNKNRRIIIETLLIDLVHIIQIGNLDSKGLSKCATKIKDLREERELLKREMSIISGLHKLINEENKTVKNTFIQLANNAKDINDNNNSKEYHVRNLDKDLYSLL